MDEDSSTEQKTWQVYSFGKRNAFRLQDRRSKTPFKSTFCIHCTCPVYNQGKKYTRNVSKKNTIIKKEIAHTRFGACTYINTETQARKRNAVYYGKTQSANFRLKGTLFIMATTQRANFRLKGTLLWQNTTCEFSGQAPFSSYKTILKAKNSPKRDVGY